MNKFGLHNLVLSDKWDKNTAKWVVDTAARIGYDLVEVIIFDPETIDPKFTRKLAQDAGIELAIGMALTPDSDISSLNAATAKKGEETVAVCLEIAAETGSGALSGLTYAALDNYTKAPTDQQWQQVARSLSKLDERAKSLGLKLGLEAINRYETNFINTLDQAAGMIRLIGSGNMFIHMDTFHMNIEESDLTGTIHRNADLLGYAHLADNNRGLLGGGTFNFKEYFSALASVGYEGAFTVESFSPAVLGADIVGAIGLWRTPWEDPVEAARIALDFMKNGVQAARNGNRIW